MILPKALLELLLTFHSPICAQEFAGNPRYTLYWCYNKDALKQILGMTKDQFRLVKSNLGRYMKRVPETDRWLTNLLNYGKSKAHPKVGLAAARGYVDRKSYVGPPPPELKQFD